MVWCADPRGVEVVPITAITFDYWNTLIGETDAPLTLRRQLWRDLLLDAGRHPVDDEVLDNAFKRAWSEFDRRWRRNEQAPSEVIARHAVDALGFGVSTRLADALVAAYTEASHRVPRQLTDGAAELLGELKDRGLCVGVICDVGTVGSVQLRRWLDEHGVAALIDHWSFSDEVGVFKPHPQIFQHALEGLGALASSSAHVGDLRRTDVAGARAVGMTTVRYAGVRDDTDGEHPEADHVIGAHSELLDTLELR